MGSPRLKRDGRSAQGWHGSSLSTLGLWLFCASVLVLPQHHFRWSLLMTSQVPSGRLSCSNSTRGWLQPCVLPGETESMPAVGCPVWRAQDCCWSQRLFPKLPQPTVHRPPNSSSLSCSQRSSALSSYLLHFILKVPSHPKSPFVLIPA